MARVRRVALLGNSVVASSLASTLRKLPEIEVLQFGGATPQALARLRDVSPDAVILSEPASTSPDLIFQLLKEDPGPLVIGADIDGDRMVVLSGRHAILRTEDDLLEALRLPASRDERSALEEGRRREADSLVEETPRQHLVEENE